MRPVWTWVRRTTFRTVSLTIHAMALQQGEQRVRVFPVVGQAMVKDITIQGFSVSERGHGSYWVLGILRWVMVLIFTHSVYRNSRPSPHTALHYTFPTVRSFRGCLSSESEARLICSALLS